MAEWLQDLRFGVRMLLKRPGTSALAVVALALGIGLTTTMFSIVEGVLLRGLPFEESERLTSVSRARVQEPGRREPVTAHDFADYRARQTSLESLAGYFGAAALIASDSALPERLRGIRVTPNLMSVLRVAPVLGRDLVDSDAAPGAPAVALISYRQWQSRFGGRRDALGAVVRIDGTPTIIVGVMPERFGFPEAEDIWMPHAFALPSTRGEGARYSVIGRRRDGVSVERASAEFAAIARQLAEAHPENTDIIARAVPFIEEAIPARLWTTFYAMLAAVLGVMLIACVNVTNLQLARAAERTKEYALRAALGSGRWRIVRQSLVEGLVLSVAGAAIGLAMAQAGAVYFMQAIADTQPPFWIDVRLDTTVLLFVTAIVVAATLVSSMTPGLRVARLDANAVLKDDGRGATSVRMGRFGRWLVVVEVTVSCVLLVVSGLMIRGIVNTSRLAYPFATADVFHAQARFEERVYADLPAVRRAAADLASHIAAVPGVRHVALGSGIPGRSFGGTAFSLDGAADARPEDRPRAAQIIATSGYFEVLGIELRQGRLLTPADTEGAAPVAVVDQAFVDRYLAPGPALGRQIRFGNERQPWRTVVGVVPAMAERTQPDEVIETVYVPFAQAAQRGVTILARTAGDPLALAPAIRMAVAGGFHDMPLTDVDSLAGDLWRRGWAFRLFGGLFTTFGAAALVLAAAGLYGVMAFTVRRRTQEIGVRLALGASRRAVLGMVLWQGVWRVLVGIVLGLVPGYYLAKLLPALLSNVAPGDLVVHGVTAATLLAAGVLATLVPALRASAVDPLTALKQG